MAIYDNISEGDFRSLQAKLVELSQEIARLKDRIAKLESK
jgi:hypothetical protein